MKRIICLITIIFCVFLTACQSGADVAIEDNDSAAKSQSEKGEKTMYEMISAEEAKKIMDSGEEFVILDTREQDEFDSGHIPDAILIPYTEIDSKAETVIPDKDMQILVYCRSGRRSKIASESLANLGYTNVKEFGGIIDWPYEIEK